MYNFFRQNKNILFIAAGVFIVSMTALLLFLNTENRDPQNFKADVINAESAKSEEIETKYRSLMQNQEDPIVVINLDGKIDFISWNYASETGFGIEDLREKLFFSYLHPDDLPTFFSAFGKVIDSGKPVTMIGPYRLRDKNGEYHFNIGSVYPVIEDGKVSSIGITTRDISEHMDQYVKPQDTASDETEYQDESGTSDEPEYETDAAETQIKKASKPRQSEPADKNQEPVKWQKPRNFRNNDPTWITGEKLVMMLPFKLPLFPAHLLLAQL